MAKVTAITKDYPDHYTPLDLSRIEQIKTFANKHRLTQSALADAAAISPATVQQILSGAYPSSPTKKIRMMMDATETIERRKSHRKTPFVETSVWRSIKLICDLARDNSDTDGIGLVFGHVGVGKTVSLLEYTKRHPTTIYIRAHQEMRKSSLLSQLVDKTNALVYRSRRTNATVAERVDAVIKALRGSGRLIILDEATRCTADALEIARDISDDAGVGLVFAGREMLEPMLLDESGVFGEISRRVLLWPQAIRSITKDDACLMVNAAHQAELDQDLLDAYWLNCAGSAAALDRLITNSRRYCSNKDTELTVDIIKNAGEHVLRTDRIQRMKSIRGIKA